ncbi:MAG: 4a-hydroxytetrahydrobiopterin dehydratase [Acidimicrobiia bacterium]|nr:4a-hydroxytetrahydrobiopterin dehydratase [Acidimicrobiia bacterium]
MPPSFTVLTAAEMAALPDLGDWRYTTGTIEARFQASGFAAAADLVTAIATAADLADHHPDLDVRYPGVVHVRLTTHAAGRAVTDLDVALARTISALATERGATPDPVAAQISELALDALDIGAVLPFWRAVLAYVDDVIDDQAEPVHAIKDPLRIGPSLWFQQMEGPRTERNRFHLDVIVAHDVAEERLAAALAAGGTLVTDKFAKAWWILADAEGNEACICTWQDRDS